MKLMKSLLLMVMIWSSHVNAQSIDSANYFRVWQGFQRQELSQPEFFSSVADFMKLTVDLYKGRALNNYIVIIPPSVKPSYIPDELALVALSSKDSYDQIRATPEGQAYSAKHWDVFDKNTSKSAPMIDFTSANPSQLVNQTAYDMIGRPNNWATGYSTVFIGTKKSGMTAENFLSRLHAHVKLAKSVMVPKGLKGYIFIANENYEIAYLNWESKAAHDAAGATEGGKSVFDDAKEMMDVLMYQEAKSFVAGETISAGEGYSTLQR
ncbi:MAG: hypothetical protein K0R29_150 [Pseudobdellovibrio sp.]|jgi:hypothetical protein|nr:hypothetical protein [Pseudobdellovibrio sp.]